MALNRSAGWGTQRSVKVELNRSIMRQRFHRAGKEGSEVLAVNKVMLVVSRGSDTMDAWDG